MVFRGVSRSSFPIYFHDMNQTYRWKDTYHVTDHYEFVQSDSKYCDDCEKIIPCHSFVSVGYREFEPDAPIPVEGQSIQCWRCMYRDPKSDTSQEYTQEQCIIDNVGRWNNFDHVRTLKGYAAVPKESKLQLYRAFNPSAVDTPADDVIEAKRMVFCRFDCITTGEFSRYNLKSLIDSNGGNVNQQLNLKVKFCVLGRDGKTEYGQPTGSKSKKYKEAKAQGCIVVNEKFITDYLEKFDKNEVQETAAEYLLRKRKEQNRSNTKVGKFSAGADASGSSAASTSAAASSSKKRSRETFEAESKEDDSEEATEKDSLQEEGVLFFPPPRKLLSKKEIQTLADMPRKKLQTFAKRYNVKQTLPNEELVKEIKEADERERNDL